MDSFKSQPDDLNLLAALPEFSEDEVRLHGTPGDCWVIINELIYDITEFMQKVCTWTCISPPDQVATDHLMLNRRVKRGLLLLQHPGGAEILWEHLGHDATLAFVGSGHSKAAYRMLDKFLLGRLVRD